MKKPSENPGWIPFLAPFAFLLTNLLKFVFENTWDAAPHVPYHKPTHPPKESSDEDPL